MTSVHGEERSVPRGRRASLALKRAFDIGVAGALLVALAPLLGLLAVLIRLGMGRPVLFRQRRLGLHGRPFVIYKFRTMREAFADDGTPLPDRQRLTKLGAFLRRTSLDELPELANVVRGEMSLVGPRPLLPDYRDLYTPDQWRRHEMPPGIAGPVPANGRNLLSWDQKFALDVAYVDDWTLGLDLRILARTMWKVMRREGVSAEGHVTMPRFTGSAAADREED